MKVSIRHAHPGITVVHLLERHVAEPEDRGEHAEDLCLLLGREADDLHRFLRGGVGESINQAKRGLTIVSEKSATSSMPATSRQLLLLVYAYDSGPWMPNDSRKI